MHSNHHMRIAHQSPLVRTQRLFKLLHVPWSIQPWCAALSSVVQLGWQVAVVHDWETLSMPFFIKRNTYGKSFRWCGRGVCKGAQLWRVFRWRICLPTTYFVRGIMWLSCLHLRLQNMVIQTVSMILNTSDYSPSTNSCLRNVVWQQYKRSITTDRRCS